jgi:GTP-binding protein
VSYAPLIFVSAITGKRVVKILDLSLQVYENSLKKIPTPLLNRFLHEITKSNPPITKKHEPLKIKYMVQTGVHPPTFSLYSSKKQSLFPTYEKFFSNKLREEFDLWGTPIKLIIKKK